MEDGYYLGIDIGTQGLSVLVTDKDLRVVATGEGTYGYSTSEAEQQEGCYEQLAGDWEAALQTAMQQIHAKLSIQKQHTEIPTNTLPVLAIGISGQMHGEVLADENGNVLGPVRLWCDGRNQAEATLLTEEFQTKIAKRATAARFLWTCRNRRCSNNNNDKMMPLHTVRHVTTPAGWIAYRLTGEWNLGIGDAAGMFPVDPRTGNYRQDLFQPFNDIVNCPDILPIQQLLPTIRKAGEDAGCLNATGSDLLLGLAIGIPVSAAEGDQVAALAGSLIGKPGTVSCSFGTSVCANLVAPSASPAPSATASSGSNSGDHKQDRSHPVFHGVSPAVDHFCAADGKPIHMIWLRNGTTFLNTMVETFGGAATAAIDENNDKEKEETAMDTNRSAAFARIMPEVIAAPADCGGLLALPFLDDEPGLQVSKGGSAMVVGWTVANGRSGNVAKAALLSTMFNLKMNCQVVLDQGFVMEEMILTGGLVKTPSCGQILADVFNRPVVVLEESAQEGCSWGAAVMAKYRHLCCSSSSAPDWPTFLDSIRTTGQSSQIRFEPNPTNVTIYESVLERYKKLVALEPQITAAVTGSS